MDVENKLDVEKNPTPDVEKDTTSVTSAEPYLDVREEDKVQRRLRQRHVQMCVPTFHSSPFVHSHLRKGLP